MSSWEADGNILSINMWRQSLHTEVVWNPTWMCADIMVCLATEQMQAPHWSVLTAKRSFGSVVLWSVRLSATDRKFIYSHSKELFQSSSPFQMCSLGAECIVCCECWYTDIVKNNVKVDAFFLVKIYFVWKMPPNLICYWCGWIRCLNANTLLLYTYLFTPPSPPIYSTSTRAICWLWLDPYASFESFPLWVWHL